jgi:hypothetical protein
MAGPKIAPLIVETNMSKIEVNWGIWKNSKKAFKRLKGKEITPIIKLKRNVSANIETKLSFVILQLNFMLSVGLLFSMISIGNVKDNLNET